MFDYRALPLDCRLHVLQFLSPGELYHSVALVSRQQYNDSTNPGLSQSRVGTVHCGYHMTRFLEKLSQPVYQRAFRSPRETLKLVGHYNLRRQSGRPTDDLILKTATLEGVTCLDISIPSAWAGSFAVARSVTTTLSMLLPNLRYVDMSNNEPLMSHQKGSGAGDFCRYCPNLEVFRWNNMVGGNLPISGETFSSLKYLRELYLDCMHFYCPSGFTDNGILFDRFLFEEGHNPHRCILYRCKDNLERVSLKGATFQVGVDNTKALLPQSSLIKFAGSAPRLKWFRCHLLDSSYVSDLQSAIVFVTE